MGQLDIFGSQIHEYLFVIEPDQKTVEKLIQLKKLLHAQIPLSDQTLQSKPHISICYFEASDFSDELIISKSNQAISVIESFDINLSGCEKWKNGTFVLKIKQDQFIQKLQKELSLIFKGVIQTPHLTIARNISKESLDHLSIDDFQYTRSFKCQAILLLKKTGNEPYQILHQILLARKEY